MKGVSPDLKNGLQKEPAFSHHRRLIIAILWIACILAGILRAAILGAGRILAGIVRIVCVVRIVCIAAVVCIVCHNCFLL